MKDWLITLRKDKKLSQQDIADKAGVTRQMISAIENGEATPSVKVAQAIGTVLDFNWTKFYETDAQ